MILHANHAALEAVGRTSDQIIAQPLADLISPAQLNEWDRRILNFIAGDPFLSVRFTTSYVALDGSEHRVDTVIRRVPVEPSPLLVIVFLRPIDISLQDPELATSRFDTLTGLADRSIFFQRLGVAFERAKHSNTTCGVLFIDVDNFKQVNDRWGHVMGDEVLR